MDVLKDIQFNEFDAPALKEALKNYKHPKDKITLLLKKGRIISVKKGLYVHGHPYRKGPYSKEILANLIYGPSYISLEYALSYYNMIPERTEVVTSVTPKRKKDFTTPLGHFIYYAMDITYYRIGFTWKKVPDGRGFFIATPEKALIDKLYLSESLPSVKAMLVHLTENLRIDESALRKLDLDFVHRMVSVYKKKSMLNLVKALKRI